MNELQSEEYRVLVEFDRICRKHTISYSLGFGTLLGAIRHQGFIPWDDDVDVIISREEFKKFRDIIHEELSKDFTYIDHEVEAKYWYAFPKIRSNIVELKEKSVNYLGIHQGVWIDIFICDAIPDDPNLAYKQRKKVKKLHNRFVAFVFTHVNKSSSGLKKLIQTVLSKFNYATQNINFMLPIWYNKLDTTIQEYNDQETKYMNCLGMNFTDIEYDGGLLTKADLENTIMCRFEDQEFPILANFHENLTALYGDYMTPPVESERTSVHSIID